MTAPCRADCTIWGSEEKGNVNINERIVALVDDVESNNFKAITSLGGPLADPQFYSLVVTGAFMTGIGTGAWISSSRNPVVAG